MKKIAMSWLILLALTGFFITTAQADEITDWNVIMFQAAHAAGTNPLVTTRVAAIVQASVFDAVNGIERRYTPIHVTADAPRGASKRAAAIEAAYASLVLLYPSQKTTLLDPKRALSLAGIASGSSAEHSESIERGIAWGDQVAAAIWAWRNTDGFSTVIAPYFGVVAIGVWRSTPPGLPFNGLQFATMTPWVISSPSQFRPLGPPALGSAQYAAEFNETKNWGRITPSLRSPDETLYSQFWNASTAPYYWNQIAVELSAAKHLSFSENARLLALVTVSMADAAIGCWEAKVHYQFWRPITAIQNPNDNLINPATSTEATWTPLLVTPAHSEYPSGHSCVSGAAGRVLSNYFGAKVSFSVTSDVLPNVTRYFSSITAATDEIKNARVFAGIHFRTATNHGQTLGVSVADWAQAHALRPVHGDQEGQNEDHNQNQNEH